MIYYRRTVKGSYLDKFLERLSEIARTHSNRHTLTVRPIDGEMYIELCVFPGLNLYWWLEETGETVFNIVPEPSRTTDNSTAVLLQRVPPKLGHSACTLIKSFMGVKHPPSIEFSKDMSTVEIVFDRPGWIMRLVWNKETEAYYYDDMIFCGDITEEMLASKNKEKEVLLALINAE